MSALVDIYALRDPKTGAVRYIGKANCARKRFASHLRDSRRRDTPVYRWIRKLASIGMVPELMILISVPPDQWEAAEMAAISKAKAMGIKLLNVAEGGDEPFCSHEVRSANGSRNVGLMLKASRPVRKLLNYFAHQIKFFKTNPYVTPNSPAIGKYERAIEWLRAEYEQAKANGTVPELEARLIERFPACRPRKIAA